IAACLAVTGFFINANQRSRLAESIPVPEPIITYNGVMVAPMAITLDEHAIPAIEHPASSPNLYEIGAPNPPASPTPPLAPDETISGRVLVVVNLSKPLSKEFADSIASITARLAAIGLDVQGDYPGNAAPPEQLSAQLDLTARALAAAGSLGAPVDEVHAKLQAWLNTAREADLVLWIAKSNPDAPEAPQSTAEVSVTLIADPADARLNAASRALGLGE
ncbi:MAG: hypothetical protein JNL50_03865, partial [Phycisphaerae bacterium]|nr:hypothetical protein [Phycisphaerae bacterium]